MWMGAGLDWFMGAGRDTRETEEGVRNPRMQVHAGTVTGGTEEGCVRKSLGPISLWGWRVARTSNRAAGLGGTESSKLGTGA